MKHGLFSVILTLLASSAFAQQNLSSYDQRISQIASLETTGQYKAALMLSMHSSLELASQIGLDQAVTSVTSSLNEIQQQVVTQRNEVGLRFNLLGLFKGKANGSWDVAKMVAQNPQEVADFGAKVERDYRKLKNQVVSYIRTNELSLIYAKAFAAKTLQLANKLGYQERKEMAAMISSTAQQAQRFTFTGVQAVDRCLTTHYAERSKKGSASLSLLFFSLSASGSQNEPAYTTQACSRSERAASSSESAIFSARLFEADHLIQTYEKALGLKNLSEAQPEIYPTWGLSSYQE